MNLKVGKKGIKLESKSNKIWLVVFWKQKNYVTINQQTTSSNNKNDEIIYKEMQIKHNNFITSRKHYEFPQKLGKQKDE